MRNLQTLKQSRAVNKDELAKDVSEIIKLHEVNLINDFTWGNDVVPRCFSCGYLGDKEDPSLHTANIVLEYLEGYYKERYSND